jgi:hypothetical protein
LARYRHQRLENEIIKEIVLLCGGNPEKAAHLFGYD